MVKLSRANLSDWIGDCHLTFIPFRRGRMVTVRRGGTGVRRAGVLGVSDGEGD